MTEREARKLAKEVVSDEYAVIDEIWNRRRVNYHSVAADYDRDYEGFRPAGLPCLALHAW